jgi:hypothetical protein
VRRRSLGHGFRQQAAREKCGGAHRESKEGRSHRTGCWRSRVPGGRVRLTVPNSDRLDNQLTFRLTEQTMMCCPVHLPRPHVPPPSMSLPSQREKPHTKNSLQRAQGNFLCTQSWAGRIQGGRDSSGLRVPRYLLGNPAALQGLEATSGDALGHCSTGERGPRNR